MLMAHCELQESKCLSSKGHQSFPQRISSTEASVPPECLAPSAPVSLLTPATVLQKSYSNVCKANKQIPAALWAPDLRRRVKFCRITWSFQLRKWWYTEHLSNKKPLTLSVVKTDLPDQWAAKDSFKSGPLSLSQILETLLIEITLAALILQPVWV